jgi:ribosomal protein S18 acetylase RimI-like enzyme
MQESLSCLVQPITLSDEPFLWEMLYQAIYVPPGGSRPPRQVLNSSELSRYVQGWGKEGDLGLKAVTAPDLDPRGAAWLRMLSGKNRGYGYVDDATPELCIAVLPERRGKGIGTLLLRQLLASVDEKYEAVSLSVNEENPAVRLYTRLGFEVVSQHLGSLTMKKVLVR